MSNQHDHDHDEESFDGFSLEEIKKNFKALGNELEHGFVNLHELIDEVDEDAVEPVKKPNDPFAGFVPGVTDFLARANTEDECLEIIRYCLSKGEIDEEEAERLLDILHTNGPEAFGSRPANYYNQHL